MCGYSVINLGKVNAFFGLVSLAIVMAGELKLALKGAATFVPDLGKVPLIFYGFPNYSGICVWLNS